jgi:hypothetical protein
MAKLKTPTTLEALDAFLRDHPPAGASIIRAALARKLAGAVETVPDYGVSRVANALAQLVDQLEDEVELEAQAETNLSWLREKAS